MSDNNNQQSKCIKRVLMCGGLYAAASCLPGIVPAGAIATLGVLSADRLSAVSVAIAGVIAGNTANAIDNLFSGKEPDPNLLANEDLTKAVGRAIAAIITLVAEDKNNGYNRRTRRHLLDEDGKPDRRLAPNFAPPAPDSPTVARTLRANAGTTATED